MRLRFLRGLKGGTGGAEPPWDFSMPLFRLAPGGNAIVPTEEVLEMNIGSEMSCLFIDLLRCCCTLPDATRGGEVIITGVVLCGRLCETS